MMEDPENQRRSDPILEYVRLLRKAREDLWNSSNPHASSDPWNLAKTNPELAAAGQRATDHIVNFFELILGQPFTLQNLFNFMRGGEPPSPDGDDCGNEDDGPGDFDFDNIRPDDFSGGPR